MRVVVRLSRRSFSSSSFRQSQNQIESKWAQLMRANPFAVFGKLIGIEPTDKLPTATECIMAILGDRSQLVNFYKDLKERVERYCDDNGLVRTDSSWSYAAREQEQTMESFLEGAAEARKVVTKWARGGEEGVEWFDPSSCLNPLLSKDDVDTSGECGKEGTVTRLTFFVAAKPLALKDFVHRNRTFAGQFVEAMMPYHPPFKTVMEHDVVHVVDERGFFNARFELDPNLFAKVRDRGPTAFDNLMARKGLTWPLDPQDFLQGDDQGKKSYRGYVVVDVEFALPESNGSTLWTFARQCDHRRDARWSHDWKIVDIDGKLSKGGNWDYNLNDILSE